MNEERIAANAEERDEATERMLDSANLDGSIEARIEQATEELILDGSSPLWTGLAAYFPEITTGDDPGQPNALAQAFRDTAREWVEAQMKPAEEVAREILLGVGVPASIVHTGGGVHVCKVELPDDVGYLYVTDGHEFYGREAGKQFALGIYSNADPCDEGAVEGIEDGDALIARCREIAARERELTAALGERKRTPIAPVAGHAGRTVFSVLIEGTVDGRRIVVYLWHDERGPSRVQVRAIDGTFSNVTEYADRELVAPSPIELREVIDELAQTFPPVDPPDDHCWLTRQQFDRFAGILGTLRRRVAADDGYAVESVEIRPATGDDRYSLITVGEIVHNVVVADWQDGKSRTSITAVGESGEIHGEQGGE